MSDHEPTTPAPTQTADAEREPTRNPMLIEWEVYRDEDGDKRLRGKTCLMGVYYWITQNVADYGQANISFGTGRQRILMEPTIEKAKVTAQIDYEIRLGRRDEGTHLAEIREWLGVPLSGPFWPDMPGYEDWKCDN